MSTTVTLYGLAEARTGAFFGFGTLLEENMVAAHPRAARQLLAASGTTPLRVRCQIIPGSASGEEETLVQVTDGEVLTGAGEGTGLVAVKLDTVTEAVPDSINWQEDGPGRGAEVLRRHLEDAAAADAPEPPLPAPQAPDPGPPAGGNVPGIGGPWCSWWHNGWGCHH
jgi:hypothetical protein